MQCCSLMRGEKTEEKRELGDRAAEGTPDADGKQTEPPLCLQRKHGAPGIVALTSSFFLSFICY